MIVLAFVMLAVALAMCVEGIAWTRATRRRLDEGYARVRVLLDQAAEEWAAECEEFGCHDPEGNP